MASHSTWVYLMNILLRGISILVLIIYSTFLSVTAPYYVIIFQLQRHLF